MEKQKQYNTRPFFRKRPFCPFRKEQKDKTMKKTIKPAAKAAKCAAPKACAKKPRAKKPCARKAAAPATKAVTFTLRADANKSVFLAGTFNDWNPTATAMSYEKDLYAATVELASGTYEYKFVVDGLWMADPECADFVANDKGTLNSVVTVK